MNDKPYSCLWIALDAGHAAAWPSASGADSALGCSITDQYLAINDDNMTATFMYRDGMRVVRRFGGITEAYDTNRMLVVEDQGAVAEVKEARICPDLRRFHVSFRNGGYCRFIQMESLRILHFVAHHLSVRIAEDTIEILREGNTPDRNFR